ncbi:MAG TPA: hypothetical protein VES36_10705, partial [Candidatus Limnocylindrales bacterium]|nr:hypothetical protein [Candidatus Limnocylindrales bacterium]
ELLSVALEPEQRGIWHTLWRAHLVLGVIGAAAGWALYQGFRASDNAAVLASPTASLVIMIGFGTVFGLLAGGLVALRPDQAKLATSIRGALGGGSWVVLVHATHPDQITRAVEAMKVDATEVLRSL